MKKSSSGPEKAVSQRKPQKTRGRPTAHDDLQQARMAIRDPHLAWLLHFKEEVDKASHALSYALSQVEDEVLQAAAQSSLERLLDLMRAGRAREEMHNRNREYDEQQHAAQLADLMALVERLDVDGSVRAVRSRITIIGELPEVETWPSAKDFEFLVMQRNAPLLAADKMAADTRVGQRSRDGARKGSEIVHGTAHEIERRDKEVYETFEAVLAKDPRAKLATVTADVAQRFGVSKRSVDRARQRHRERQHPS